MSKTIRRTLGSAALAAITLLFALVATLSFGVMSPDAA